MLVPFSISLQKHNTGDTEEKSRTPTQLEGNRPNQERERRVAVGRFYERGTRALVH